MTRWPLPEPMALALAEARLAADAGEVPIGAVVVKGGAVEHGARLFEQAQCLHRPEVYPGIGETEAAAMLRSFFRERR